MEHIIGWIIVAQLCLGHVGCWQHKPGVYPTFKACEAAIAPFSEGREFCQPLLPGDH